MKKILLITLALAAMAGAGMAQVDTVWVNKLNFGSNEKIKGCTIDNLGYIYIVCDGYSSSRIVKYDQNGDTIWSRNTVLSNVFDCSADASNDLYISGDVSGQLALAKYNSAGDTLWLKSYTPSDATYQGHCAVDDYDNIYVCGHYNFSGTSDYYLMKYNQNGDTLWTAQFNSKYSNIDCPTDCCVDNNGNVIVTGTAYDGSYYDILTVKFNSDGDTIWSRYYHVDFKNSEARGCVADDSGNVYVIGFTDQGATTDYIVIKYDSQGDTAWCRTYNSEYNQTDRATGCTLDRQNNLYVTGACFNGTSGNLVTIKYTTTGDTVWSSSYMGVVDTNVNANASCAIASLKNPFVAATSVDGDTSLLLIKYIQSYVSVDLIEPQNDQAFTFNTPQFLWHQYDTGSTYRLQISPFSDFASLTIDTTTSDTSLTSSALPNNWYYWRVKAYGAADSSEWSEVRSFSVATTTVDTPLLVFPPADTTTNDSFPDFDWSDVSGATQYQLQVGEGYRWVFATYNNYYGYFYTFNASDSRNMERTAYNALLNYCEDVAIKDTVAYVIGDTYLHAYNIRDPHAPAWISSNYSIPAARSIIVRDSLAFIAAEGSGLLIMNIKDPANITQVGSFDTPGYAYGLAVNGNYVYVADYGGGLRVIDITDPTVPVEAGSLAIPDYPYCVTIQGNYAYVGTAYATMKVVNISTPSSPVEVGTYTCSGGSGGEIRQIVLSGNLAYLAARSNGLRIVNVSNPISPIEFGYYDSTGFDGNYSDVVLRDTLAYVADMNNGIWVLSVADPYHPRTISYNFNNTINSLVLLDSMARVSIDTVTAASACTADTFVGDGKRYWRVRAGAGTWGQYTAERRFTMDTQPPPKTSNVLPSPGQLINNSKPVFDYSDITEAYRYQLQVAGDSAFVSMEIDSLVSAAASICTLQTALGDGRHWWHVRAIDLAGNIAVWSDSTYFRLDTQAPLAPTGITASGANPSPWRNINSFSINFTPPTDTSGISQYYFKIGSVPSSNYDTTYPGYINSLPYTAYVKQQGVSPFYVWAKDLANNLDYQNRAMINLRFDSTDPSGTIARSNEFSRTTNFTVSWNAGSDQGGSGLNGNYWIKYKVNSGTWTDLDVNYSGASYAFNGTNGSKYYFEVAAWDSAGNSEAFTGVAECSTLVDNTINFPILVTPYNNVNIDTNQIDFIWQRVPGYTGSRMQCSYDAAFTSLAKDTLLASDSSCALSLADSLYYWRAQGYNTSSDTSSWSPYRTFRTDTKAPAVPILSDPPNDTLTNDNTPFFVWKDTSYASQYRLELSSDSNFIFLTKNVTVDSAYYILDIALPDSIYYWRVCAGDAAGNWSAMSDKNRFTVDTKAPIVPVMVSPSDNASLTTSLPEFIWGSSPEAVEYRFQVSLSTDFGTSEYDTSLTDTVYTPEFGLNDGTHYWRVRCRDMAGNWSAYSGYRTVNIAGILQVAGVFPGSGMMWPAGQSVWIQFTKPIYTGYIDTTHIKIRGKRSAIVRQTFTWQAASRTLMVSPDSTFAANDTVTIFLHGTLRDSANVSTLDGNFSGTATGDSTDSYQMNFYTTQIGDYDTNRVINSVDLALFAWAWIQPTYYRMFEAGPLVGTWPHQKIYVGSSSRINFEDLAGFIYSWNMADNSKAYKSQSGEGPVVLETVSGDEITTITASVNSDIKFISMDAEIDYDGSTLKLTSIDPSNVWRQEGYPKLFLSKQQEGKLVLSAAKWNEASAETPELFSISFKGSKNTTTPITFNYRLYGEKGQDLASGSSTLSLNAAPELPARFYLGQAAPNPANRPVTISYQLPRQTQVRLDVYNVAGQRVATLTDGIKEAGYYNQTWDLRDQGRRNVSNGIYFYKLVAGEFNSVGKVVVIK
jgi:hypothetical protein